MTAIALTIAGSHSGGGASIQADLKTFSGMGASDITQRFKSLTTAPHLRAVSYATR